MRVCGFSECLYHACHCPDLKYMCLEGELAMNSDSQFSIRFFTSATYVCVIKPSKSEQSLKFSFFPLPFPQKKLFLRPKYQTCKCDMTNNCLISEKCRNLMNIKHLQLYIYIYITDTQCFTESRRLFQLSYIAKLCAFAHGFFASMYRSLAISRPRNQSVN